MTAEASRRSPLAGYAGRFAALSEGRKGVLAIREVPFLTLINVRTNAAETETMSNLKRALGLSPPVKPNTVSSQGDRSILWLGPDEWLIVSTTSHARSVQDVVRTALGDRGSIVDVSANRTVIELEGAAARELLEHGCAVDLHPRYFRQGQCAQTMLAKAQVIIEQTDAIPTYLVFVRASFAGYLAEWLLDAAGAL